jgi:hypothetical protein
MLKLTQTSTFATTVKVRLPTERPGVFNEGDFTARFKFVEPDKFLEFVDGVREVGEVDDHGNRQLATTLEITQYQREVLGQVLEGVEGIGDGNGTAFEPDKQKEMVFAHLTLLQATFDAFFSGYRAAPAKNSKRSPKR